MKLGNGLEEVLAVKLFSAEIGGVEIYSEPQYDAITYIILLLEDAGVTIYKELIETLAGELQNNYYGLEHFEYSEAESETADNIYDGLIQVETENGGNFNLTNQLIAQSIIMDRLFDEDVAELKVLLPTKDTVRSKLSMCDEETLIVELIKNDEDLITGYTYGRDDKVKEVQLEAKDKNFETITEIAKEVVSDLYHNPL